MRRALLAVLSLGLTFAIYGQVRHRAATPAPAAPEAPPQLAGSPLAGLTTAQTNAFNNGRTVFDRQETVATGLGPVFNDQSCRDCHNAPVSGGGSIRTVTRFGRTLNGVFDPLTELGGSLVQSRAIGRGNGSPHNFVAETIPAQATIATPRRTTPLFGLGLVDATPDSTFVALAALEASRGDGTAGRVNMTDNIRAGMKTVGRFGWKAQVPTLLQFAGDALLNEEGITNPDFPNENCPQGDCAELSFNPAPGLNDSGARTTALADFMTLLAPPLRGAVTADVLAGEQLFTSIGCASCHVASLSTGASAIAALDRKTYHPYSDFLLHDMGSLGDRIAMGSATGSELRTEPLWGLRFVAFFLHDGRATSLGQAIVAHDGQASAARDRYAALDADSKRKLQAFLQSL